MSWCRCCLIDSRRRGPVIGRLIVISGPSGSGKGVLIERLLCSVDGLVLSVSATTRKRRHTEEDGREYRFITQEEFDTLITEDRCLEWACYSGNYYGTPAAPIEEHLAAGRDVVLEIELEGAWQVFHHHPDSLMIFIMPPSLEELERRLRGRNTETEESIRVRMARAREEIAEIEAEMGPGGEHRFDYVIVNDEVTRAAAELVQVIQQARKEYE